MNTAPKATRRIAAMILCVATAGACQVAPFASDTATSNVRLSLAGAKTSSGLFVCSEAEVAGLWVTPDGLAARRQERQLGRGESCSVEFTVTVPRGQVDFTGELMGGGRPLMRGSRTRFPVRKSGFVVRIDLSEVDALDVRTKTIGTGGPTSYMLEVDGSTAQIPIDRDAVDTLAALAGGPRFVTLHPEPCVVVNGPARREVMIPTDEGQLGATLFEIDCRQGNGLPGSEPSGSGPPASGPPASGPPASGPPGAGPPTAQNGTLRVVVEAVQPPLPGEVLTFDAVVTDMANTVLRSGVSVGDSVSFVLPLARNPFDVALVRTGSCKVIGNPNRRVNVPAAGAARVVFDAGC